MNYETVPRDLKMYTVEEIVRGLFLGILYISIGKHDVNVWQASCEILLGSVTWDRIRLEPVQNYQFKLVPISLDFLHSTWWIRYESDLMSFTNGSIYEDDPVWNRTVPISNRSMQTGFIRFQADLNISDPV